MGCTSSRIIKSYRTNVSSQTLMKTLTKYKEELVSQIYYLHKLYLICGNEIESCIINHNKKLATLIKMKQQAIKEKLETLRQLVGHLDSCIEKDQAKIKSMVDLERQCQEQIKQMSIETIYSNKIRLLSESSEEQKKLQQSLEKFSINIKQVEIEMEHEIQIHEVASKNGQVVRRRYQKARSTI